jgi:hypothetical protein
MYPVEMTPRPPQDPPRPEIDPNYVNINYSLLENKLLDDFAGNLLMKTEDAKRLSLMIGDVLTIRLIKDDQK